MTMSVPPFNVSGENHLEELQHFPFICNHLIPVAATTQTVGDYNLNFTISSSLAAGFNRGTLQSNPHVTLGSGFLARASGLGSGIGYGYSCPNDPSFKVSHLLDFICKISVAIHCFTK
ncbi:hypothetical protein Peur_072664 [Populus x canadensis]